LFNYFQSVYADLKAAGKFSVELIVCPAGEWPAPESNFDSQPPPLSAAAALILAELDEDGHASTPPIPLQSSQCQLPMFPVAIEPFDESPPPLYQDLEPTYLGTAFVGESLSTNLVAETLSMIEVVNEHKFIIAGEKNSPVVVQADKAAFPISDDSAVDDKDSSKSVYVSSAAIFQRKIGDLRFFNCEQAPCVPTDGTDGAVSIITTQPLFATKEGDSAEPEVILPLHDSEMYTTSLANSSDSLKDLIQPSEPFSRQELSLVDIAEVEFKEAIRFELDVMVT
jgi:hypothetical protein